MVDGGWWMVGDSICDIEYRFYRMSGIDRKDRKDSQNRRYEGRRDS